MGVHFHRDECNTLFCEYPHVADGLYCANHTDKRAGVPPKRVLPDGTVGDVAIVCTFCAMRGRVTTRQVTVKQEISGEKATVAVLTGGLSVIATGLSRKQEMTEFFCGNCAVTWAV